MGSTVAAPLTLTQALPGPATTDTGCIPSLLAGHRGGEGAEIVGSGGFPTRHTSDPTARASRCRKYGCGSAVLASTTAGVSTSLLELGAAAAGRVVIGGLGRLLLSLQALWLWRLLRLLVS